MASDIDGSFLPAAVTPTGTASRRTVTLQHVAPPLSALLAAWASQVPSPSFVAEEDVVRAGWPDHEEGRTFLVRTESVLTSGLLRCNCEERCLLAGCAEGSGDDETALDLGCEQIADQPAGSTGPSTRQPCMGCRCEWCTRPRGITARVLPWRSVSVALRSRR